MSQPAVQLRNIGVCYRLYKERVYSLKEAVLSSLTQLNPFREKAEGEDNTFWAIRKLDLEIGRGVCVGLTGRNGSGKSTTLKVISGVLHPTEGEMWVRGRISALIELGAGFDPNLTGRENVYLGASVAGLSRKEADLRMDRIVDFAELKDFIDVPVRNYSSGMYARLGFALATDVDPDLLIVDEVLSVGDASFQDKCRQRMEGFKRANKTILFVSHDDKLINAFCDQTVHLEAGRLSHIAPVSRPLPV